MEYKDFDLESGGELRGSLSATETVRGSMNSLEFIKGYSAFEVAVINGFKGTEEEWLASLVGADGSNKPVYYYNHSSTYLYPIGYYTQMYYIYITPANRIADIAVGDFIITADCMLCSVSQIYDGRDTLEAKVLAHLKGADGEKGADGAKGDKGEKGDNGTAATITVGTVTTGAAGTSASVTNVGTSTEAKLNFTIPRGAKGDKGDKGDNGENGKDGVDGKDGITKPIYYSTQKIQPTNVGVAWLIDRSSITPADFIEHMRSGDLIVTVEGLLLMAESAAGSSYVQARVVSNLKGADGQNGLTPYIMDGSWWIGTENQHIPATGAAGQDGLTPYIKDGNWWIGTEDTHVQAKGVDGEDGEDGRTPSIGDNGNWWIGNADTLVKASPTIAVGNVITGAAGTPASVTNIGTSSAAIFNFSIPKGDSPVKGKDYWTAADKNEIAEVAYEQLVAKTTWQATKTTDRGAIDVLPKTAVKFAAPIKTATKINGLVSFIQAGIAYTVVWRGWEYTCVAYNGTDNNICIGNGTLAGEPSGGNGETFCLVVEESGTEMWVFKDIDTKETVELWVYYYGDYTAYSKLPVEHLPDDVVTKQNILSVLPIYDGEVEAV